jgi:hypothetical protein
MDQHSAGQGQTNANRSSTSCGRARWARLKSGQRWGSANRAGSDCPEPFAMTDAAGEPGVLDRVGDKARVHCSSAGTSDVARRVIYRLAIGAALRH